MDPLPPAPVLMVSPALSSELPQATSAAVAHSATTSARRVVKLNGCRTFQDMRYRSNRAVANGRAAQKTM
jgi:hypothetical protein